MKIWEKSYNLLITFFAFQMEKRKNQAKKASGEANQSEERF